MSIDIFYEVRHSALTQDNLDPPAAFAFSQEFFGIDSFAFLLANGTSAGAPGWLFSATASSRPACSFALFFATPTPLPSAPAPNPTPAPVPAYAAPFVGDWTFDATTCNATAASACCCLVGAATVYPDPQGAQSFFITGTPSAGCQVWYSAMSGEVK